MTWNLAVRAIICDDINVPFEADLVPFIQSHLREGVEEIGIVEASTDDMLTYGNPQGGKFIEELEKMKRDIKVLQAESKQTSEDRLENSKVREEVETLRSQVQDLTKVSEGYLSIRRRFFETYKRQYTDSPPNQTRINAGNAAAHYGDVSTDAFLFKKDKRGDRSLFIEIYGIDFDVVVEYGEYSNISVIYLDNPCYELS